MIALLAPGQGAQKPGMLSPWLDLDPARQQIDGWSDIIGLNLIDLGTTATAEEIQDTAITQPLIVALGLIAFAQICQLIELPIHAPVAGHSIGEITAAVMAGVFSSQDAMIFASARGQAMAAACELTPTGMTAVLGGDPEQVMAWLAEYDLVAANINGAGQIVAAGACEALEKLTINPLLDVRVIPLKVAGAFHTQYMTPAEEPLRRKAAEIELHDPERPLLANADAEIVTTGTEELSRLIHQVTLPVRWDKCMDRLVELGVTGVIELPPAGTLSGLIKRALPTVATLPLKSPEDLDKLPAFVAEHGGVS